MRRWFDRLPIHQKLVATALVVTTLALLLTTGGLIALDLWRYRATAVTDTASLAQVLAENSAAAVLFREPGDAQETLATTKMRPGVRRACLYLADGTVFAAYERTPAFTCQRSPDPPQRWDIVQGSAWVVRNGRTLGTVYVERDLPDMADRVLSGAAVGLFIMLSAAGLAYAVAQRLHRTVSTPITRLATAAREIGEDESSVSLPRIDAAPDEVGELVQAFTAMVARTRHANQQLRQSNEALRGEISRRQRIESEREDLLIRERRASRLKDEFLAAVSHELRTPLNAILGWTQILATTPVDEDTNRRAIASIGRNAKAQTRVIEDLVDVSRIATGKLSLRFDLVDFREPIEAAVEVVRPAAQVKNLHVEMLLPESPCWLNGDRDRLQQIVWNLASNAVKFTDAGTIRVTLANLEGAYELSVSDSGIGIRSEFLPYVFDRFRQADGSMTREKGGLGLGLAIVKELTELHGGVATAGSAGPGEGATFTVRLPCPQDFPHAGTPHVWAESDDKVLANLRVLAIDDNIDALEVVATFLTSRGAEVRAVTSGADAIAEIDRAMPDVIICDLAMPQMDGFEVLQQVKRRDASHGRATPTIAFTAHASADHRAKTLAAGFDFYLAKPVQNEELLRTIRAAGTATRETKS